MDPDGKKIKLNGTKEEQVELLKMINTYSKTKFGLDENGYLYDTGKTNKSIASNRKSRLYAFKLLSAIEETSCTIVISLSEEHKNKEGEIIYNSTSEQAGGGATTWYQDDSSIINVTISPYGSEKSINPIYMKSDDTVYALEFPSIMNSEEVLIHELIGHAIPILEKWNGNAINLENAVREELKLFKRKEDQNHVCY